MEKNLSDIIEMLREVADQKPALSGGMSPSELGNNDDIYGAGWDDGYRAMAREVLKLLNGQKSTNA